MIFMINPHMPDLDAIKTNFCNEVVKECPNIKEEDYLEFKFAAIFPQVWSDTSLGFDSEERTIAGQAITTEYTIIPKLFGQNVVFYGVYFGERLAYILRNPNENFMNDIMEQDIVGQKLKWRYTRSGNFSHNTKPLEIKGKM